MGSRNPCWLWADPHWTEGERPSKKRRKGEKAAVGTTTTTRTTRTVSSPLGTGEVRSSQSTGVKQIARPASYSPPSGASAKQVTASSKQKVAPLASSTGAPPGGITGAPPSTVAPPASSGSTSDGPITTSGGSTEGPGSTTPAGSKEGSSTSGSAQAVRRLFDAQVLLKSYEEQLSEKEFETIEPKKQLKKLQREKMLSGGVPGEARPRPVGNVADDEPTEDDRAALEEEQKLQGNVKHGSGYGKKIPYWLRNDERSRQAVERERANLMRQYMVEGHLDPKLVVDLFWNVGMEFALRWGGHPDEEIVKQNEAIEARTRKVQKDALQETSMLRQHCKKLEKKNQQLLQQLKAMASQVSMGRGGDSGGSPINGMTGPQANAMRGNVSQQRGYDSQARANTAQQRGRTRDGGGGGGINDNPRSMGTGGYGGQSSGRTPSRQGTVGASNNGVGQVPGHGARQSIAGSSQSGGEFIGSSGSTASPIGENHVTNYGSTGEGYSSSQGTPNRAQASNSGGQAMGGIHSGPNAQQGASWQNQNGLEGQTQMGTNGRQGALGQAQGGIGGQSRQGAPMQSQIGGQLGVSSGGVGGQSRQGAAIQNQIGGQPGVSLTGILGQRQGGAQQNQFDSGGGSPISGMVWHTLAEDETLILNLEQEDLDTLDNELFEPLVGLDEDLRELAIDVINEKVRRILSTDPSKFKGGRLPYGLRPDKLDPDTYQRVRELESELEQLKEEHRELKEQYDTVRNQLEAARGRNTQLQNQKDQPPPQEQKGREKLEVLPTQNESRRSSQDFSPSQVKGATAEEVAAEVKRAVDLVTNNLNAKLKDLEQKLKASEAQLETARKKLADSELRERDASQRAARAEAMSKKSDGKPDEESPASRSRREQGTKPRTPSPVPEERGASEMKEALKAAEEKAKKATAAAAKKEQILRKTQESYKSLIKRMHLMSGSTSVKNRDKVEALFSKLGGDDTDAAIHTALEEWGNEAYQAIRSLLKKFDAVADPTPSSQANKETPRQSVQEQIPEDAEEISRLNSCVKAQQDEISRLLLTIDELRARIEAISQIAADSGPDAATTIKSAMKKAGLKEIMETGNAPKLKGVFERLYQDALQRITRSDLIRQRMLVANQAYSSLVNALVAKEEVVGPESIPDLDRLSNTASATLSGMWYNTDFLFRNACNYAIAQGVESSLSKNQILSLAEMMDAANSGDEDENADDNDPNHPDFRARRRANHHRDRLPGRRCDRSREFPGSAGENGRAFWSLPGGLESGPKSPRSIRKEKLADPGQTSFSSYITALREARGDLRADEWPRCTLPERQMSKGGDGVSFCPKTLKASIAGTRSLPVLPKGRGGIFQPLPEIGMEA